MKSKKIKLLTTLLLFLPLCVVLLGAGCDDEDISQELNLRGSWQVYKQIVSGELKNCIDLPENANFPNISIVVPDTTKGVIHGNTFYNTIGVDFEIGDKQQIDFKNYGGTRLAEDDCGLSLGENLRNTVKFDFLKEELLFIDSDERVIIVLKKMDNL